MSSSTRRVVVKSPRSNTIRSAVQLQTNSVQKKNVSESDAAAKIEPTVEGMVQKYIDELSQLQEDKCLSKKTKSTNKEILNNLEKTLNDYHEAELSEKPYITQENLYNYSSLIHDAKQHIKNCKDEKLKNKHSSICTVQGGKHRKYKTRRHAKKKGKKTRQRRRRYTRRT
jgi:hypothetical protein